MAEPSTPAGAFPPPTTSVVIDTPPKRSRKGLVAAVSVLVVAGLAVGGVLLLRGGDDPVTYSLEVAATRTADAPGYTNLVETSALGDTLVLDGTFDNESELLQVKVDLGEVLGTAADITAVVDPANKVMFMATEGFGQDLQDITDKAWVRIDQKALADAGQDAGVFDQIGSAGQVDVPALLAGAKTVTDRGTERFVDEQVRHYEVVVRVADVKGLTEQVESQASGLDATMPGEITYDLYVTKDNEIRRIVYDIDLGVAEVSTDLTQHLLATAPGIAAPADDEVVDINDLG